jgi:hypothetical protein
MSDWMNEPEGTAVVVFDDGSAIIRAVDIEPLTAARCLVAGGTRLDPEDVAEMACILAEHGVTVVAPGYPYRVVPGKTMDEGTFRSIAEYVNSLN